MTGESWSCRRRNPGREPSTWARRRPRSSPTSRRAPGETILTSPLGGAFVDLRYQWEKIRKAAELPAGRRLFDARHTYKSVAEDLGLPRWRVDVLMGHSKAGAGTSGRYSHLDHRGLLQDADRVSSEIWRLLGG